MGTNNSLGLTINSSNNAVFTGDVTVGDDLFMPSGGVINFDSSDVTLTHSGNKLALNGGFYRLKILAVFY